MTLVSPSKAIIVYVFFVIWFTTLVILTSLFHRINITNLFKSSKKSYRHDLFSLNFPDSFDQLKTQDGIVLTSFPITKNVDDHYSEWHGRHDFLILQVSVDKRTPDTSIEKIYRELVPEPCEPSEPNRLCRSVDPAPTNITLDTLGGIPSIHFYSEGNEITLIVYNNHLISLLKHPIKTKYQSDYNEIISTIRFY